jgi:hypothetical protein
MTRIKVLGLALVAVFAMAAISAAGASAGTAPVFFECAKSAKGAGHHLSKTCNDTYTESGGKYELKVGVGKGKAFKSSGGKATLHTINPEGEVDIPVSCESFKGVGKDIAPNIVVGVKTTFSKCKAESAPCENVKKETIETTTLAGHLGWLSKAGKVVGTVLTNETTPGGLTAEFTCTVLGKIRSTGAVIGVNGGNVGSINKVSSLTFTKGPYLGKVVYDEKGDEYTPVVNVPVFEGEAPIKANLKILLTEVKGAITGHPEEFYPPGGLPSGQEGVSKQKGEAIEIAEEGTV